MLKLTKKLEAEVRQAYNTFWKSLLNVDLKTFNSLLDDNFRQIGTTEAEVFFSRKATAKYLKVTEDELVGNIELRNQNIKIEALDNYVLITDLCDVYVKIDNEWAFYARGRNTFLLHKTKDGWKFSLQHTSLPDHRTEEGETAGLKKIEKENLELRDAIERCTIELEQKNRELEVETALEKVRAIAMGMKGRDDMLKICNTISKQLAKLGVREIRNVQTAIFYESRGTYMNYEYYAKHDKTIVTETTYTNNRIHKAFAIKMLKGRGQIFFTYLKGKKVKEWLAYQKTTNVFIDKYLNTASSLNYYWHSLGPVALGISTYSPLNKDEIELFQRFLKVFELAYRRYMDIEKANAQARKAQIEVSLERVRAAAMAMRDSTELGGIIYKLYGELTKLDTKLDRCFIMIVNPENKGITWWLAGKEGLLAENGFFVQMNQHRTHLMYLDCWKKRKKKWQYLFEGREKKDWDRFGFSKTELVKLPEPVKKDMAGVRKIHLAGSSDQFGSLVTGSIEPLPEEQQDIISRFTIAFNQAYTRFLDLQKAETQAKESQIQLALERVRARTMAMHKSDELADVVALLHKQFEELGFGLYQILISIINTEKQHIEWWSRGFGNNEPPQCYIIPFTNHPFPNKQKQKWESGETYHAHILEGDNKKSWEKYLFTKTDLKYFPEEVKKQMRSVKQVYLSDAFMKYGALETAGPEPLPQDKAEILIRFAKVLDQAYTRMMDLQKAEIQAREAQINLGVERVRSKALAMHKSEEILDVVKTMRNELGALSIPGVGAATIYLQQENGDVRLWDITSMKESEAGIHFSMNFNFRMEEADPGLWIRKIWDAAESYIVIEQDEHDLRRAIEWTRRYNSETAEMTQQFIKANKIVRSWHPAVKLSNGKLATDFILPPQAEVEFILTKMGTSFDLAYTRFLDLQKAEAQAREAQIEVALERVRSRTMAMHKSDELLEASEILFSEMQKLGIESLTAGYVLMDKEEKNGLNYTPDPSTKKILPLPVIIPHDETIHMRQVVKNWKKRSSFYVVEMNEEETIKHQTFIAERSTNFTLNAEQLIAISPPRLFLHNFYFKEGYLLIVGGDKLSAEQTDIMLRFTKVFQQTYTRFLDLQKAEAQAREAQIEAALERVRSRSMAMHKSEELADLSLELVKQVQALGVATWFCAFNIYDDDPKGSLEWGSNGEGTFPRYRTPREGIFLRYYEAGQRGETLLINEIGESECPAHYDYLCTLPGVGEQLLKMKAAGIPFPASQIDHVAYFKYGYIIFITYKSVPESHDIFIRFAKVFEQTYTRFLDLQKAEAQAREAQIEAALERVRSRSMGMHKSEELADVIKVIYDQMGQLNFQISNMGFLMDYQESNDYNIWMADSMMEFPAKVHIPYFDHIFNREYVAQKNSAQQFFAKTYSFEEKTSMLHEVFKQMPGMPEEMIEARLKSPGLALSRVLLKNVGLYLFNYEAKPYSDIENHILIRFAKVFEQTYTRFKDLEKAEAQARESQIQLALERVRARTMAMHKSDELPETSHLLFEQMKELGEPVEQLTIGIVNEENNAIEVSATLLGDTLKKIYSHSIKEPYMMAKVYKAWKKQQKTLVVELRGDELNAYNQYRNELTNSKMFPTNLGKEQQRIVYAAFFSKGMLALGANETRPPESLQLLEKFASVFDLTYTRFLDLQKAEAQAREAQIETALERVRSRSMGMQKSDELKEVIKLVYQQLIHLKINLDHAGFVVDYKSKGDWTFWIADEQDIPSKITHPYFESVWASQFNEAKEKGADYFVTLLNFEEKNKFYHELLSYVPGLPQASKDFYLSCPGLAATTVLFNNVGLYIENFSGTPYTDEENSTLMRFGKVFQQTYTRFLDLQKAEAQAREAQIEASLERVRSASMAMHSSDELENVIKVLTDQLIILGFEFHSANFITNASMPDWEIWISSPGSNIPPKLFVPYFNHRLFNERNDAVTSGKEILTVVLSREEKSSFLNYFFEHSSARNTDENRIKWVLDQPGMALTTVVTKSFSLSVINYYGKLYTESENEVIKRLAFVFEQSYTRFLDLQKAEAQAREAQIEAALERVRASVIAMQNSSELQEISYVFGNQMRQLRIDWQFSYFWLIEEEKDANTFWITWPDNQTSVTTYSLAETDDYTKECLIVWKTGQKMHSNSISPEGVNHFLETFKQLAHDAGSSAENVMQASNFPQGVVYYDAMMKYGSFGLCMNRKATEEENRIQCRFAIEFERAYTRFLDLKQAEELARQAEEDLVQLKIEKQRTEEALNELQVTQKQLIQAEKMASLGELTAGIAHEIQNPLNFVNNFSEVSKELLDEMKEALEKGDTGDAKEIMNDVIQNLEKINHHGKRADGIVKGMLQHSRTGSGQKELTDINALCDEYLRLAFHGLRAKDKSFNAKFETSFDETVDKINVMPQDMGRVILNLINNAFYAVSEKKKQGIPGYGPIVTVSTQKKGDMISISVKDNGNGIPQKVLNKIFQPFFTTKPTGQGTGLGLSLSYDIVKAHDGELQLETKEGHGSEFFIVLPVN